MESYRFIVIDRELFKCKIKYAIWSAIIIDEDF